MTGDEEWNVATARINRDRARGEYELYKRYDRPSAPYYLKCLQCGDIYEKDELLDADHETRYHSGYHGGLLEEDAEIVVTDSTGREIWRHHAIHDKQPDPETCEVCDWPLDGEDRVSCPHCGAIPEEARL